MADILFPKNKQLLKITGFADETGQFIDNAVITATLLDPTGAHVAGLDGLAFDFVALSNGDYQAVVPGTFDPAPGSGYTLQLVFTVGGVLTDTINRPVAIEQRTA